MRAGIIAILWVLCNLTPLCAQVSNKLVVTGLVREAQTAGVVAYATVAIPELGLWGLSAEDGTFTIKEVPTGTHTFTVTLLGYETLTAVRAVSQAPSPFVFELQETSLRLEEVVVTAKEGGGLNSSSRIEKQALDHVQPSSIKDVLQLLPGSITENPSLNEVNKLTIRDLSGSNAGALGTALVLDGATVSNDANLQVRKTASIDSNGESTAGSGVDARQISTDNIESIEVIRGIPSVEYGDLTSGAVVVKTRAGVAPWQIRLKADPKLKQVYAGKGFSMGPEIGVVNVDMDYALSYGDIRTPAEAFRRVNVQLGYAHTFFDVWSFNTKIRAGYADANNATDPDNFLDNISRDLDKSLSVNMNGKVSLNKPWITNVEYVVAGDVAQQYSQEQMYRSTGRVAHTLTLESGESLGFYSPYQYYSNLEIFGLPVNLQAKLSANLYGKYGSVTNKVLVGMEWSSKGNRGQGKVFDPYLSPDGSSSTYRQRSYKDIPFLHRYTFYAEDKLQWPLGTTDLEVQAGVRVNGLLPHQKYSIDQYMAVEPRFNARYRVLRQSSGFRDLSFRAGWGVNYKMPSMLYLYPEPTYLDVVSFSYNDLDDHGVSTVVFTTKKLEEEVCNTTLKWQKSVNFEAAVEFVVGEVSGSVVYYNEYMTNGYGFSTQVMPVTYTRYGYTWENGSPVQQQIPSGKLPMYRDGGVWVDGAALPKINDTLFLTYSKPVNSMVQKKWGIEYTLDFPEIKALHTSISVNGAYMSVTTQEETEGAILIGTQVAGRPYPFAGIYAGGNKTSTGNRRDRLNANVRFITHIPRVGMVVTLTAQVVFVDRTTYVCELNDEVLTYYYDDNGVRHGGTWAYDNMTYTKRVNPLYLVDMSGQRIPFTQEMEHDPAYQELIGTTNKGSYYVGSRYPVYGLLNLRLTKEIGSWAKVSFYANNFLNIDQLVMEKISRTAYARNLPLYFGAEVTFTL